MIKFKFIYDFPFLIFTLTHFFSSLSCVYACFIVMSVDHSHANKFIQKKKKEEIPKHKLYRFNSIFGILNYVNFVAEISKMAYVLQDVYDWYRDLMENKSGMYSKVLYSSYSIQSNTCLRKKKKKKRKNVVRLNQKQQKFYFENVITRE